MLFSRSPHTATIAQHTPQQLRLLLQQALLDVGLSLEYKWYSLRRVGATAGFQARRSWDFCLSRGRWFHLRTAKKYINEGLALLGSCKLSPDMVAALACQAKSLRSVVPLG